ncbi:MAG: PAS domain S-box protein [Bacteroidota bacterium]
MLKSDKKYRIQFGRAPVEITVADSDRDIVETDKIVKRAARVRIVDENERIFMSDKKIFELKNVAKALQESEEKNRLLMDNSGLGIGYYDKEGRILMLNHEAVKNFGGKASDYIGKNLTEIFGNEDGQVFIKRLNFTVESGSSLQYEDYMKHGEKEGWYLSTYTRILDGKGNVDGIQVIANNITDRKLGEKKLKESQKKLQKLARHLDEIMENERSLVALNLHDDLGQELTAIKMNIAWVKSRIGVQSQAVNEKIDDISQMISETIESIKEISSFLRPLILFDLGLVPAFASLLKKFEKQSGIRCLFSYEHEEFQIGNRISLILYRILQESLTNIARHSEASLAEVKLRLVKNKIEMQITDNGKGIGKNEVNSLTSMGIAGLKERVRSISGRLLIKGEKGFGTSIKVSIPLKNGSKDD